MFEQPVFPGHPTVGAALEALLRTDPETVDDTTVVAEIRDLDKLVACVQAAQARRLARFAGLRPDSGEHPYGQFAADELACALSITTNAAHARLDLALVLTRRLPATLAALGRGDIDLYKARTLAEVTEPLSDAQAGAVEDHVLARAATQTASQLRQSARRLVLRIDPDGAQRRHEQRNTDRTVQTYPLEDGMAALNATLPATHATAIYDRLDAIARNTTPKDTRGMDARRADALVDLLLAQQPGSASHPVARVHVTVPASTLAGAEEEPGDLASYGPIPADMARHAATDGVWRRLVTDPTTGALLDYGRSTYRPPTDLADFIRARDVTCRFPSCRQPATHCDLDHTTPHPKGATDRSNLGALCRHHHRLKHESNWQLTQSNDGIFTWTSPTSRTYTKGPEPPDPPPDPTPKPAPDDEPPPF